MDLAALPPEIISFPNYADILPRPSSRFQMRLRTPPDFTQLRRRTVGEVLEIGKYFIDLFKFPESLEGKLACFIGVSARDRGAVRAIKQLQAILIIAGSSISPNMFSFRPAARTGREIHRVREDVCSIKLR